MAFELTKDQITSYVESEGLVCPSCGSDQIGGGAIQIECNLALQPISCGNCKATWVDIYTLTTINNYTPGEQNA